jgi:hypothetical protein
MAAEGRENVSFCGVGAVGGCHRKFLPGKHLSDAETGAIIDPTLVERRRNDKMPAPAKN